jgi:predicted nucleic acid-binding protein
MATTAAEPVFVDTNNLIYAHQAHSPFNSQAIAKLLDLESAGHPLWISRQVLREYLAAMSRPGGLTAPVPMASLVSDVQTFQAQFHIAEDGPAVTAQLLHLLGSIPCGGKQVHDANIVATMLAEGIGRLLTHNVQDFKRFAGIITVIPLIP